MKSIIFIALATTIFFGCDRSAKPETIVEKKDSVQSGYAPVNNLKLYYEIHGTGGTPLVLLHGGGSTIQTTFGVVLPILAKNRQVIAVELQAHGHTADIDRPMTFEQDADDIAALLDYLKISKADVLGFSNGGSTTLQMGIRHPNKVNRLVAISAIYRRDGMIPGFFEGMNNASLSNMPAYLKEEYLRINPDTTALLAMFNRDKNRMLEFKDWNDELLRSIQVPVLIVAGDHDVVTMDHQVAMSKLIPNASLLIVPGNHGSFIGEMGTPVSGSKMPEFTAGMIEDFLNHEKHTNQ